MSDIERVTAAAQRVVRSFEAYAGAWARILEEGRTLDPHKRAFLNLSAMREQLRENVGYLDALTREVPPAEREG